MREWLDGDRLWWPLVEHRITLLEAGEVRCRTRAPGSRFHREVPGATSVLNLGVEPRQPTNAFVGRTAGPSSAVLPCRAHIRLTSRERFSPGCGGPHVGDGQEHAFKSEAMLVKAENGHSPASFTTPLAKHRSIAWFGLQDFIRCGLAQSTDAFSQPAANASGIITR